MSEELKDKTIELLKQALQQNSALKKKVERMHTSIQKLSLEKTFWQRKVKYYAPNKIQEHYNELDKQLKEVNLYFPRKEENPSVDEANS